MVSQGLDSSATSVAADANEVCMQICNGDEGRIKFRRGFVLQHFEVHAGEINVRQRYLPCVFEGEQLPRENASGQHNFIYFIYPSLTKSRFQGTMATNSPSMFLGGVAGHVALMGLASKCVAPSCGGP